MFDEALLDDGELLTRRDEYRLLWTLATAGAQVRRAAAEEFGLDRLRGEAPRAMLVATDAPVATAARVLERLGGDRTPVVIWHGVELPRWAGASDALLIGALDGQHPRLVALAEQGARRGLATAVVAPMASQVALAAGRNPMAGLAPHLNPTAALWAVLTPLLRALDTLGLVAVPPAALAEVADALDAMAETCRPDGLAFTNPAKALAIEFAESVPVLAGAGALAGLAARATADALVLRAGVPAVAVSLPDEVARAGALLRGAGPSGGEDFFRDRTEEAAVPRARLVVIGDDGLPDDPQLGPQSGAHLQLDEVAARRAAAALHALAHELGLRSSGIDGLTGSGLARFAAATTFGEFTAAYLALGLGLNPGAARPAELAH